MANFYTFEVPEESSDTDFNKMVADSNSMETPPALFEAISDHFGGFDIDVAASGENFKVNFFPCEGLNTHWYNKVWCNPPYSNPYPWVAKAHDEVKVYGNAELAVLLLRFDPSTKLWRDYADKADEIYILTDRRVRFIGRWRRDNGQYTKNTASNHPHMLMVFRG